MDLKIINEQQNPLFDRKEITATTVEKVVPKREDVMRALAKKYSVPVGAIRILTIKGSFGSREFTINANIYSSKEQRDEYEKLTKKEKELDEKMNAPAEEPKPEEKVEEAPAEEEKPKEEPAPSGVPSEEGKTDTPVEVKEEPTPEEDKKEKDKSTEEKLNETELQA